MVPGGGMRLRWLAGLGLLAVASGAQAADLVLPTRAPRPATRYDWIGFYLGGHIGYAGGSSHWTTSGRDVRFVPIVLQKSLSAER